MSFLRDTFRPDRETKPRTSNLEPYFSMTRLSERWELTKQTIGSDTLSIVMPVYNLVSSIAQNLETTAELFESRDINTELVPVDDGSSDGTAKIIDGFVAANKGRWKHVEITPVLLAANSGKGSALKAGFLASKGAYVMLLDGDLDIKPKQTPYFFESLVASGADVVIGSKRHHRSVVQYPWHRRLVSWVYFKLVKIFIGLPITDTQTGMKLFRREVLGEALARMLLKTYAFDLELLSIAYSRGAKIAEAPVVIKFGTKLGALKPHTISTMAIDSLAVFYRLRILKYYKKAEAPKPMPVPPLVSVVIACPGDSAMLRECLDALAQQTHTAWEAIVIPDESIPSLESRPRTTQIVSGKVRPAEKRNLGIQAAKGEIVAFIDDDAYADPKWLENAVKYFGDETVGAVGGPGITPPGDSLLASLGGRVYANLLVAGNYRYRYVAGGVRRDVDDFPSCNLLVRKSILDKIGGYRTDFWPGEDTLLCKDIIDSGVRIVYDPWAIVNHHRRALFAPHLRQLGRYAFHRGYFMKRYPSNSLHLSYFIPSAFLVYLIMLPLALLLPLPFAIACAAPLALYLFLAALTAFSLNPVTWLITLIGVFATHITYGFKFLLGLSASKAPCEFIGKDKAK